MDTVGVKELEKAEDKAARETLLLPTRVAAAAAGIKAAASSQHIQHRQQHAAVSSAIREPPYVQRRQVICDNHRHPYKPHKGA